jgi:putative nucleotidyltransferase with HDIG domain
MSAFYQYIVENKSHFFLYLKLISSSVIILMLLLLYESKGQYEYRVLMAASALLLFGALLWTAVFFAKVFKRNIARVVIIIDWVAISAFAYPVLYANVFFPLLPVLTLTAAIFLLPKKETYALLVSFFVLFSAFSLVYGLLNIISAPFAIYASQLSLLSVISLFFISLKNERDEIVRQNKEITSELSLLENNYTNLKRELSMNHQRREVLNKDIRKKDMEIKNILNLSGQLSSINDSSKALSSFIFTIIGQIGGAYAVIFTQRKKEHNFMSVLLQKGLRGHNVEKIRIYFHSNLTHILSAVRDPLPVKEIPRKGLYEDEAQLLNTFSEDILCPVFVKDALRGIFVVGHKISGKALSSEDRNLLGIVTNQMSFILEQTQTTSDYQDFYQQMLRAMINALEAKYTYSKSHSTRTAKLVNDMAIALQLPENEKKEMVYGALLHDVGKIAVKDEYLLNVDKITEKNIKLKSKILQHTVEGEKILKKAGFNDVICDMALHHHEFYDGSGYPHHIGRSEISLGSRILGVCNAYDAMLSRRPHREALSSSVAKEYLQHYSGSQYDPEIVNLFLEILNKK